MTAICKWDFCKKSKNQVLLQFNHSWKVPVTMKDTMKDSDINCSYKKLLRPQSTYLARQRSTATALCTVFLAYFWTIPLDHMLVFSAVHKVRFYIWACSKLFGFQSLLWVRAGAKNLRPAHKLGFGSSTIIRNSSVNFCKIFLLSFHAVSLSLPFLF